MSMQAIVLYLHWSVLSALYADDASPSGMQAAAVASANRGGPASTSKHPSTALGSAQASQLAVQKVVLALGSAEWRSALVRRGRVAVSVQLGSGPGEHVGMGMCREYGGCAANGREAVSCVLSKLALSAAAPCVKYGGTT